jgi:two-component system, OmpR family, KDP operon response regulator KdpE
MTAADTPQNILVVDDEPQIVRVLRRSLESSGFHVWTAPDARTALDIFKATPINFVVTDLRMPDMDGIELCQRLRKQSRVPIIVLSVKGEEAAKVQALDSGADDYVTKPFGMDELLARIRALSRRAGALPETPNATLEVGDFRAEPEKRRITVRGHELQLTPKEYDLLLFFLSNHDKVVTHRAVLSAVWGSQSAQQSEYLRVFVAQLRKKIEKDPRSPRYLLTEPWIGYRFQPGP